MRIMAIDYGDAHTGVAISDPTGLLAGYTTTVNAYTPENIIAQLRPLIEQYHVEQLVLGCPKNMDGTEGPRAEKSRRFQAQLQEATGIPGTHAGECRKLDLGQVKKTRQKRLQQDFQAVVRISFQ